jgi:CRP-like cAMP-binding protein
VSAALTRLEWVDRPRYRRSGFFDELAQLMPVGEELTRRCPALMLPAGVSRGAAELPEARLLVVEDGLVLVRFPGGPGRHNMIVAEAGPGSILFPPGDGDLVQGLVDSWVTLIPGDVYQKLLAEPAVAERLMEGIEATNRRQREMICNLGCVRHVERVREKLIQLARDHGRVCRDGVRLDCPLTHELVAEMVGSARETVTRAFEELQQERFISRQGRIYRLLVPPELLNAERRG